MKTILPSLVLGLSVSFVLAPTVSRGASTPTSLLQQAFPDVPTEALPGGHVKDVLPLTIVSARTWGNPTAVEVVFSAPVSEFTATNKNNYSVSPGITVTRAVMGTNAFTVWLTTTAMADGTVHTLTVNNVQDRSSPPNTIPANSRAVILKAQGVITRKAFSIDGCYLPCLTNDADFPNNPAWVDHPASLESPQYLGDAYGLQFVGYVHPPVNGDYMFYVSGDDQAVVFLSTNGNPADKVIACSVPGAVGWRQYQGYAEQQSAYFTLAAGRPCYIEVLMAEGGGNDHVSVAWRLRGLPAPANGDAPIPGAFLSSITPSGPAGIAAQPQSQTVNERASARFGVWPTGTPPYSYQWYRNGLAIPGATGTNYTIPSALFSDNGAVFSVAVSNWFSGATSTNAVLTVVSDTTPPTLTRLSGGPTLDRVLVTFSEPVALDTAMDARNYRLNGGLSVIWARLMPDQSNVVLATSPQVTGQTYSLTVTGVTDTAALRNRANTSSNFTAWVLGRGFVRREAFYGIGGGSIAELLSAAKFPDAPDVADYRTELEAPQNIGGNSGERLVGYLMPPSNGFYTFYMYSADQGALFLSTDESPANKAQIALEPQWNWYRNWVSTDRRNPSSPENRSAPIYLQGGRRYYFEALMKDSDGDNRLGVTWQWPGAPAPRDGDAPISGTYLWSYADPTGVTLTIDQPPQNATVPESTATNFSIAVSSSYSPVFYQWQKNGVDIPGANAATYTTPRLFRTDNNARFRCVVAVPGRMLVSSEAVLTVTPDNVPPQALSAATLVGSPNVGVCFNELMDPASVTNPANYTLSVGGAVTGVTLRPDGQSVSLTVNVLSFTNYIVRLNNVKDYAGNALPPTNLPVAVQLLENRDLGRPGSDPVERGSVFTCRAGEFDVLAGGGDFWETADRGHFLFQPVEGDFDVSVRLARHDGAGCYARGGLMARENLTPGSPMVNATMFPQNCANRYEAHYRGGQDWGVGVWPGPNTYVFPGIGVPLPNAWVRLTRSNNFFTAYASTNGSDWIQWSQIEFALSNRLFLGLGSSAQYNAGGVLLHDDYRGFTGVAHPLTPIADLLIKKASEGAGAFALDNVYQLTPFGAQAISQWASPTNPALFTVQVQNDGPVPQSFVLRAADTGEPNWTVTYRVGTNDITAQITNTTGYVVTNLIEGGAETLTVELLPNTRVLGGTARSVTLSVFTDAGAPTPRDTVKATAINEIIYQPDLLVRRLSDVTYHGDNIYNATGAGQTKSLAADSGVTAAYPVQLANDGNLTNTFTLRGTAGGGGWTVRYFDAVTGGADMTADIVAGTKFITLMPGGAWEFHVEVTADGTVPGGASNVVLVTGTSTANTSRLDTVKLITSVLVATNVPQKGVFTTDADFERGTRAGTVYGDDQLTLGEQSVVPPYIWVPNNNEGTVSKVDIRTGQEKGRYRTGPPNVCSQPSRTTVDLYGNCWLGNRYSGTAVKIGLYEAGQYFDRNGDGIIQTSQDLNDDGDITGDELLPWGQDECVLWEVSFIPGYEGTFVPGTFTGPYQCSWGYPGPRGIAADAQGNVWIGTYDTRKYYYIDGETGVILRTVDVSSVNHTAYGAVIDANGILWSSSLDKNHVLRLDPADDSFTIIDMGHTVYGLGLDNSNHLYVAGWQSSVLSRINVLTGTKEWTRPGTYESRGVAITRDGDVWTANSGPGTVSRRSSEGDLKATIPVGNQPTGVSVDSEGRVWVVDLGDENIHRIRPETDTVDLTKRLIGTTHYGYSDMTGNVSRNATVRFGTWTVVHDARVLYTHWGKVSWTAFEPAGAGSNITVRVRSSNDLRRWSNWEKATNNIALQTTPPGRWIELEVAMRARVGEGLPVLYDITVEPLPQNTADLAVTQAVTPAGVVTNDHPLTYTLTVTNLGPHAARGVVLSNWLGAGVSVLSYSNSQGTVVQLAPAVRVDLGLLGAASNATLTLVVEPSLAGPLTNIAAVSGFDLDNALANNVAVVTNLVVPNPCLPPPEGLVGWWPGEGDASDLAGANPGSLVGNVAFVPGKVGQAFSLDGSSAWVNLGSRSPGVTWSLEAWIKPSAILSGRRVIMGCHADCRDWSLVLNEGQIGVNIGRGGCVAIVGSGVTAVTGQWYHVVGTCDGATATIYVNGQPMNSGPVDFNYVGSAAGFRIGSSVCCGEYFAGVVDEASLYNRALASNEVFALYDTLRSGKCKPAAAPTLTVGRNDLGQFFVAWPATTTGFTLVSAEQVDAPLWQPVSETPVMIEDQWVVFIDPIEPARFFRLRKP